MRSALFAATAFFSLAAISQTAFAEDAPYVDDRSDAAAVIRSLYSAINRHEFARAWDYYGDTKPAKDFDTFVKGYDGTDKVDVKTGAASSDGAAGSIFYNVPVAIQATDKNGEAKVFAGCYTLRQVNAQVQEPPFRPILIDKGALKPSTANFEDAVPASCGDGPPPPKHDTVLEKAKKAFVATYSKALARELAPEGLRVNCVSPGTITTDFHERYSSPEKLEATRKTIPLGRLGTAEDCAPAYLFLASHALSGYITGQVLEVNGGQLIA